MNLFPSPWELYSHPFPWEIFSIPRNILYPGIKFSKLVTNIGLCIFMILFPGIYKLTWNKHTLSVKITIASKGSGVG